MNDPQVTVSKRFKSGPFVLPLFCRRPSNGAALVYNVALVLIQSLKGKQITKKKIPHMSHRCQMINAAGNEKREQFHFER